MGVQVELKASGLPKPGASYYAQVHGSECADVREGEGYEREHGEEDRGHTSTAARAPP